MVLGVERGTLIMKLGVKSDREERRVECRKGVRNGERTIFGWTERG